ncbi:hypothetical protein, partial [Blautia sp. HCP3S3_B11]
MTKIKNTKKGMAKKTLSMSLVVAMLATSNVPVWAAEFSDGSDVNVASEAEAPVAESADEFTDDAAATADTAEAPVVDDGTEADVATASSLVYDDSKLENFKLATAGTVKLDVNGTVDSTNGEWGKKIKLPEDGITFKEDNTIIDNVVLYYYWTYNGKQIKNSLGTSTVQTWEDINLDLQQNTIEPTKEQCIEGGSFGLRIQLLVNGEKNFDKTYDFGAARAVDLTNTLKNNDAASRVKFEDQTYNAKEQKPAPELNGVNYIYKVQRNGDELGVNDFAWDYVRTIDATGKNDLISADANVGGQKVSVTAKVTKPGYTGSFVIDGVNNKTFDINQKELTDESLNVNFTKTSYEFTGDTIYPKTSEISVVDKDTNDDLSSFVASVIDASDGWTGKNKTANITLDIAKKGVIGNYTLGRAAKKFKADNTFEVVKRDLSKCSIKLDGDYQAGELDNMIAENKSFTWGNQIFLYDADGKELKKPVLIGLLSNKVVKNSNNTYSVVVSGNGTTGTYGAVENVANTLTQNISSPDLTLRDYKVYLNVNGKRGPEINVTNNNYEYTEVPVNFTEKDIILWDQKADRQLTGDSKLFKVECDSSTDAGEHRIKIVGQGSYAGSTLTAYYHVKQAKYSKTTCNDTVVVNEAYTKAEDYAKEIGLTVTAVNGESTPKTFTLTDKDMKVEYTFGDTADKNGNKNIAHNTITVEATITNNNFLGDGFSTADAKRNTDGTITITKVVEIVHPSIADATVEIKNPDSYVFTGEKILPDVTVTASNGTVLKEGVDYRLDVKHGLHAGTAEVVITAVKECSGAKADPTVLYETNTVNSGNYFTIKPADINDVKATNSFVYKGEAQTPTVAQLGLKLGKFDVTNYFKGTGYAKDYQNNVNAGTATVALTVNDEWKNDFTASSADIAFAITPVVLTENQVNVGKFTVYAENGHILNFQAFEGFQYDGTAKTFKDADYENSTIKLNNKAYNLVNGKDYTIEYADNVNPDQSGKDGKTARVYVKLSQNFTIDKAVEGTSITTQDGTVIKDVLRSESYRIAKASVENAAVSVTNPVYDGGNKVAPTVKVTVDGKELVEGTDYVLVYDKDETYNATKEASKLVTVKGINGYVASSKTVKWGIDAKDIASDSVKVTLDKKSYKVNEKPEVTVADGKTILDADEYSVAYTDMENGVLTITGAGKNYTGTKEVKYEVAARSDLADATIKGVEDVYVTGEQIKPEITVVYGKKILTEGTDYTVTYGENTAIGEGTVTITAVEGSVDYKGTQTVTFQIKDYDRADLADATIKGVDKAYYVTGEQIKPEITVVSENEILKENEDYTVTYGENTEIGEGTVTITAVEGSKKFTGSQTVTFQIKDYDRADLADATIKGVDKAYYVTGEQIKPEIT